MKILVTGAAGFIGSHITKRLLSEGHVVTGIDNLNDYYNVDLKKDRLVEIRENGAFEFVLGDISDKAFVNDLFCRNDFEVVINLAAQAGVRYSIVNPQAYMDSNVVGFYNILEGCRHSAVKHFIYASSSSVYGNGEKMPLSIEDRTDSPISLYAATKKTNEVMAHAYGHLHGVNCTGLRLFTVYGPWGRPDMAYYSFTRNILHGGYIEVFNNGKMMRDFTYIDDVVEAVSRVVNNKPKKRYSIYNIGNNRPVELMDFIHEIEKSTGQKANIKFLSMQAGDVRLTYANIDGIKEDYGFEPVTNIETGVRHFVDWYRGYHNV